MLTEYTVIFFPLKIKSLKFDEIKFYEVFLIEILVLRAQSNYYRIFSILDEESGTDHY